MIGGGDDQQLMPERAVFADQFAGFGQHYRCYFAAHEFPVPGSEFLLRVANQRRQSKAQVSIDIQRARFVVFIELFIAAGKVLAVNQSSFHHKLAPQVVAVTADQGVIEVENCESHWHSLIMGRPA